MENQAKTNQSIEKLGEMIEGIKVAMLTTREPDGVLRSRPMMTQQVEFDGDLWFFTSASAPKSVELQNDHHVNVSYADPGDQRYVSVSGMASLVRNPDKIRDLWNPLFKAWFPDGPDDPDLALIKVKVEQAEYWDSSSGKMVQLAGFVKALATGERLENAGDNQKLDLGGNNP
jgi:general stress protein 26